MLRSHQRPQKAYTPGLLHKLKNASEASHNLTHNEPERKKTRDKGDPHKDPTILGAIEANRPTTGRTDLDQGVPQACLSTSRRRKRKRLVDRGHGGTFECPNVVDKIKMPLHEVAQLQQAEEETPPDEEDQADIQSKTQNQMDLGRDDEEQAGESSSKRRTRRTSRPPSASSQQATKVAGTAGLAATFFNRRSGGGSANAQSTAQENTRSFTSDGDLGDFSYLNLVWNVILLLTGRKWLWKQLTRPPIQCMDGLGPMSKAKATANVPSLEPEEEPVGTQIVQDPTKVAQGESLSLRKIWQRLRISLSPVLELSVVTKCCKSSLNKHMSDMRACCRSRRKSSQLYLQPG